MLRLRDESREEYYFQACMTRVHRLMRICSWPRYCAIGKSVIRANPRCLTSGVAGGILVSARETIHGTVIRGYIPIKGNARELNERRIHMYASMGRVGKHHILPESQGVGPHCSIGSDNPRQG